MVILMITTTTLDVVDDMIREAVAPVMREEICEAVVITIMV